MLCAIPDAVMVPERLKTGRRQIDRINSILDLAEPILGVDRSAGERAYIRRQGDGWLFITKDPADTICFPLKAPLQGQPRYLWVDGPDDIKRGWLKGSTTAYHTECAIEGAANSDKIASR